MKYIIQEVLEEALHCLLFHLGYSFSGHKKVCVCMHTSAFTSLLCLHVCIIFITLGHNSAVMNFILCVPCSFEYGASKVFPCA